MVSTDLTATVTTAMATTTETKVNDMRTVDEVAEEIITLTTETTEATTTTETKVNDMRTVDEVAEEIITLMITAREASDLSPSDFAKRCGLSRQSINKTEYSHSMTVKNMLRYIRAIDSSHRKSVINILVEIFNSDYQLHESGETKTLKRNGKAKRVLPKPTDPSYYYVHLMLEMMFSYDNGLR